MKYTLTIIFLLAIAVCNAQKCVYGEGANCNMPITHSQLGAASGVGITTGGNNITMTGVATLGSGTTISSQKTFVPKFILRYDTVKCIVIYLDAELNVKADSCLKISKATVTKEVYHSPPPCSMGASCLVYHVGNTTEEPDWQLFKVATKHKKIIELKDVIQYK